MKVTFKYEKMSLFCFGYGNYDCDKGPFDTMNLLYGSWLRVQTHEIIFKSSSQATQESKAGNQSCSVRKKKKLQWKKKVQSVDIFTVVTPVDNPSLSTDKLLNTVSISTDFKANYLGHPSDSS